MKNPFPLALIGFGNQAKAWAFNLRDQGLSVVIALREGSPSFTTASQLNFETIPLGKGLSSFGALALLIPDDAHLAFLEEQGKFLREGARLIYAHAASLEEHALQKSFPQFSHLLLAPKAIAVELRSEFRARGKLGACFSLEASLDKEKDMALVKKLALALGITGGPYPVTFREEALADLLSEQGLLCGLLPYAALHVYNLLRRRGISSELAFMECWCEIKLIADTMVKKGPEAFFQSVSPNALMGADYAQKIFFDEEYQKKLEYLYHQIETGAFFSMARNSDAEEVRNKISSFWKKTELNTIHQQLAKEIIPETREISLEERPS